MVVQLRPDLRRNDRDSGRGNCRKCGGTIVLLPNDRRQGYCFECYDGLELPSPSLRGD